ncbi:Vacuolar calcium ion transporter [Termitomyces sp. J132]|nr:Vacuolar calcium ion transporter [Termitomyces sp. J132]
MRQLEDLEAGLNRFVNRFTRKGKKNVPVVASLRAIAFSSWLNLFVIFIPLAWIAHFVTKKNELGEEVEVFPHSVTFTFCFLALVPLEWLFDWGGEQLALYLGTQLGDFVVISLNKWVEASAEVNINIVSTFISRLKLLQSTIVGVVILHLLLIPGAAFITGGANIVHQQLHPHFTELNHTLLTMGHVLSLLLPAAFFSAINRGVLRELTRDVAVGIIVNDDTRHIFLVMSRGIAVLLLAVYVSSRIFLHNPPGKNNALMLDADAPAAMMEEEKELLKEEPKANQYVLIVVLLISIAIMAATTEWLVESIEFVPDELSDRWFGMFLLPICSWAANGFVTIVYFIRYTCKHFFEEPEPPAELAKARAIDLSIQFTLFWMPFLVMLGWWTGKPMSLLFDFFEVAVLLGSCFLVNYVTADAKTNWAEGFAMVAFYCMIAVCAWFYTGQPEINFLLSCQSVAEALTSFAAGGTSE